MKKTTLIAKRATLSYRLSMVVYISLFLFVAFLTFELSLLFNLISYFIRNNNDRVRLWIRSLHITYLSNAGFIA